MFNPQVREIRPIKTYPCKCFHQVWNKARVDDLLDLGVPSCSDVGQSPRCLFLDVGFFVTQQSGEHG